MSEVSMTLKGGPGYDEPWIVAKAESVDELGEILKELRTKGVLAAVQAAGLEFKEQKQDGHAVRVIQQASPGAEVVSQKQELPEALKPKCAHGQMVHRAAHSTKHNRDYEGYFCPNDVKDCKPQQFKWTS